MKNWIDQLWEKNRQEQPLPDRRLSEDFLQGLLELMYSNTRSRIHSKPAFHQAFLRRKEQLGMLAAGGYETAHRIFELLPEIDAACRKDAEAILLSDPAARQLDEVLQTYPGFRATAVYRIANVLWRIEEFALARLFSEIAHSETGIDIHPAATIGAGFAIDHGTGIVIGETAVIGKNVKMYQGVTLGALSVLKENASSKRHPTIEDGVVIYANATILGGDTVIGKGSRIGGNVWLTRSVPPDFVVQHSMEPRVRDPKLFPEALNFII